MGKGGYSGGSRNRGPQDEGWLLLRKAILTNSLLLAAEAWSTVTDADNHRLEQVESALLKSLVKGHSKTPTIFHHL